MTMLNGRTRFMDICPVPNSLPCLFPNSVTALIRPVESCKLTNCRRTDGPTCLCQLMESLVRDPNSIVGPASYFNAIARFEIAVMFCEHAVAEMMSAVWPHPMLGLGLSFMPLYQNF